MKNNKLELNKVYEMDVFEFLKKLDDQSIDLAIVDPPYNMKKDKWDTFKTENEYFKFTFKWLILMLKKMKPTNKVVK